MNNIENQIENAKAMAAAEGRPIRILFVCLGNICRSPAAEGIMRKYAGKLPAAIRPELDSAGFYGGHAGDLPDRRMRTTAYQHGFHLDHRSRVIRESDFDYFDLILGMDDHNMADLHNAAPTVEAEKKIARMSDLCIHYPDADHIPDPYYDGIDGFHNVLNLLEDGCGHLLSLLYPGQA